MKAALVVSVPLSLEASSGRRSGERSAVSSGTEALWLSDFRTWLKIERSEGTISAYLQDLKHFTGWFEQANGQPFEPALFNSVDARDYRTWCLEVAKCAPATWNRRRATLAVLHEWIQLATGVVLFPFSQALKRKKEEARPTRWLTQAEERRVMRQLEINLNAANTGARRWRAARDQAMVAVMRYGALRVDEVAGLGLGDVVMSERKGQATVRQGKGDKQRVVPLSAGARAALGLYLGLSPWLVAGGAFFTDEEGKALSTRAIEKRIEGLAEQLGIEGLDCHALRHTCAKSLVDAGRPLTEVQMLLGHGKLETTKRYVQPGQEDLQEAVEAGELGKMMKARL